MKLIDTHAHLFAEEFNYDLHSVITRAKEAGLASVFLPNIDETTLSSMKRCIADWPDFLYPMIGLHPTSVTSNWKEQLEYLYNELSEEYYIAVGEIGVDLYWDTSLRNEQIFAFEEQLKWSMEKDLPVSIHFRNATKEVINSINRVGASSLRGVFHSFGGSKEELDAIMELDNFMIGVNGVVTFKNSGLTQVLVDCPIHRIVLETDAPYLAPVPYRGKRNESAYLLHIAKQLATIWNMDVQAVAEITTHNAQALFNCKDSINSY